MVYKSRMITGGSTGNFNADANVKAYLSNGTKRMSEVKTFLEEKGVKYTTDGVIKLLNRLIKKGDVKRKDHGKTPSVYYLTDKGIHDIALMASFFKNAAITLSLNNMPSTIWGNDKKVIKKVVEIGGLFNVYSYFVSLDFTGKPQQVEEKRQSWFNIIGIPGVLVIWLEDHLSTFWPEEDRPKVSRTLQITLNKKAAQKFKKILHTLYPEEMKRYDNEFQRLEKDVKNYHKLVRGSSNLKEFRSLVS